MLLDAGLWSDYILKSRDGEVERLRELTLQDVAQLGTSWKSDSS